MTPEVHIRYHRERDGWWAESSELPGWTAAGDSFEEVREQARSGVVHFSDGPVMIVEQGVPMTMPVSAAFDLKQVGTWDTGGATLTPTMRVGPTDDLCVDGDLLAVSPAA